ncbi:MAG TPA: L,D-transpeptidase [Nocardioides sp.]|nr:L,D-transpeptidase [Nocardioides sp.]
MSRHRAAPPRHHAGVPGRRRAEQPRPRYGRVAVLCASLSVTGIAMLGGIGVLPSVANGDPGNSDRASDSSVSEAEADAAGSVLAGAETTPSTQPSTQVSTQPPEQGSEQASGKPSGKASGKPSDPPVPDDSGTGYRIVFDQSDQRVWLVDDDDKVQRTYLVSGSLTDNLDPGTYSVYSRSEDAVGIDDSGTMKYFVRFTQGDNGAAIGFHDIPVNDGAPVQTVDQLGTPQSHGCIRQERDDAIALWDFAPIGTEVDVTA